jgi:hypothetical protein
VSTAVRIAAVALPSVVLVGLYLNAKRYAVGLDSGRAWFVPEAQWAPPFGWYPWLVVTVAGVVLLGVGWVAVLTRVRVGSGPTR